MTDDPLFRSLVQSEARFLDNLRKSDDDDDEDAKRKADRTLDPETDYQPAKLSNHWEGLRSNAERLNEQIGRFTVETKDDIDDDEFFTDENGNSTITNRFDLEMAVPKEQKPYFVEIDRYWVNKPYAFVSIFRSRRENEIKYFVIEPHMTEAEHELIEFLEEKLRTELKYDTDEIKSDADDEEMKETIDNATLNLLETYGLYKGSQISFIDRLKTYFNDDEEDEGGATAVDTNSRPVDAVESQLDKKVTDHQVEKILYYLRRDFVGNQKIDPITQDLSVEDISCDGYNSPVFVYHGDHEQIISNVYHGKEELDNFVTQLAQRSGKGISKRKPQVDATLPNGSRAQLTLGQEVSDHGTNYTIRQFKEVPFTPLDLINWNTFSLEQMAFFWLSIENHKNLIFAGGTASGKTTSLNAVSLFIPSSAKIVSIEDTREVELPQRNWIASVTRPSFTGDDDGDVDEFDLLEAALRQRPDYIVMGEIRGEEGRTLFQVMSTGHTTYTTFHADTVSEVIKRFTTEPINVSKTMFTALDLVSIQTQTIVDGNKVRRNKVLTEINHYDTEDDEINVQDVYEWQAETDQFLKMGESNIIQDIKFERGWDEQQVNEELGKRRLVLAYLMMNGLNKYTQVAATIQAFINEPETILTLIANEKLEESLGALRKMESVLIDVSEEAEERAGRPEPDEEMMEECEDIMDEYGYLLDEYVGQRAEIEDALDSSNPATVPDKTPHEKEDAIKVMSGDEEIDEDAILRATGADDISELDDEEVAAAIEDEKSDDTPPDDTPALEAAETEPDDNEDEYQDSSPESAELPEPESDAEIAEDDDDGDEEDDEPEEQWETAGPQEADENLGKTDFSAMEQTSVDDTESDSEDDDTESDSEDDEPEDGFKSISELSDEGTDESTQEDDDDDDDVIFGDT